MRRKNRETIVIVILVLFFVGLPALLIPQQADLKIKNIETFTRLYGYARYFYPGDEAAQTDWTRFAVYGVKKVENAKTKAELGKTLEELFLPIAPALVIHDTGKKIDFSAQDWTPPNKEGMKPVFWQHLGVYTGFSFGYSPYKSVRVSRINKEDIEPKYGVMVNSIPLEPLRDKDIRVKASVKVLEGKAQLWLRVDRPNNQDGFFDNMGDRPITSNQWASYEILGTVANDAVIAYFGSILEGKGKYCIDNFQIEVKEKESDQWKPVTFKNPSFEEDTDGNKPKDWSVNGKGYTASVSPESPSDGKKCVVFQSKIEPPSIADQLFDTKPSFGEYISRDLGSGLSCLMPIVLYGTEKQTYPEPKPGTPNRLKAEIEKEIPDVKTLSANDLYVRLADVVISWNIFQHFYPYFDVVKTNWKSVLSQTLQNAYADKTTADFLLTLKKMVAALKDGHGNVYCDELNKNLAAAPIQFGWVEGELVITDVYENTLTQIKAGDIVTEIDGVKAKEAMDEKLKYISGATQGWKLFKAFRELAIGSKNSGTVLKIKNGTTSSILNIPHSLDLMKFYETSRSPLHTSKKIEEGIYYLNLDKITMPEIDKLMPELEKAKSIICDLRGYPNENHDLIGNLLKEKDTSDAWMKIPQVIYPDYEKVTFENSGWAMEIRTPHLNAKIVFIVDGRVISYGESFMGFIEHYKLATIVGQPTAGTNGNINPFLLPGGYRLIWTGMRVVKHDGSQHHGVGIIPHVLVERSIKGIREGRDEFLEKALEIARQ